MHAAFALALLVGAWVQQPREEEKKIKVDRLSLKNRSWIDGTIIGENNQEVIIEVKGALVGVRKEFIVKREVVELTVKSEKPADKGPGAGRAPGAGPDTARPGAASDIRWPEFDREFARRMEQKIAQLRRMNDQDVPRWIQEVATGGEEAQIYLVKSLPSNQEFAGILLQAAGMIQTEVAFPYLVQLLPSLHEQARAAALTVLGVRRYADAAPAIASYLARGHSQETQVAAVRALASLEDPTYSQPILDVLEGAPPLLAINAIETIRVFAQRADIRSSVVAQALRLLTLQEETAQLNGALLAWKLQVKEAGDLLSGLIHHRTKEMREAAIRALGDLEHKPAGQALADRLLDEPESAVKMMLLSALDNVYKGSRDLTPLPQIIKLLDDPAPAIVNQAAETLANITGRKLGTSKFAWEEFYAERRPPQR